jgi:hypothetical protein
VSDGASTRTTRGALDRRAVLGATGLGIAAMALPTAAAQSSMSVAPAGSDSLVLHLDAGVPASYTGAGSVWSDLSGNANTGTIVGPTTFSTAEQGSLGFAGGMADGPYVTVADAATLDGMTAVTFELWLWVERVVGSGQPNMLFSKRSTVSNGYVGFFTSSGWTFRLGTGVGTGLSVSGAPATGAWLQVSAVFGPDGSRLHVNGAAGASETSSTYTGDTANIDTTAPLDLLNVNPRPQMGPVTMDGRLAIVRVYGAALTSAQVRQNFESQRQRFGLPAL